MSRAWPRSPPGCAGSGAAEPEVTRAAFFFADRAMAINAVDFDGGARLAKDLSVAVAVRSEVAIVALHAFFEMDVGEVCGFREPLRIIEGDLLAVMVQPVAFAIVIEDCTENPTMAVKVRESRGVQLRVKFKAADFVEEFFIAPEAAGGGTFGIADEGLVALHFRGIALLLRIHLVAIQLVVPPSEAKVSGHHIRTGMDAADHALARGDGARETVLDGMPRLIFRDGGIGGSAEPGVAVLRVRGRMRGIAVIRIHYVAVG